MTHPDLAANLWVNAGEIPGNGIDDDSNGVVDDVNGFNGVDGTGNITVRSRACMRTGAHEAPRTGPLIFAETGMQPRLMLAVTRIGTGMCPMEYSSTRVLLEMAPYKSFLPRFQLQSQRSGVMHFTGAQDADGHGTHCAGSVGAVANNALGVAGVAGRVRLLGCKAIAGLDGHLVTSAAVRCLEYCASAGAHITSNSWGGQVRF